MKPITKEQAVAMLGSSSALARALGIKPSAVSQWESGKPIPKLREFQLRHEILPKLHMPDSSDAAA